MDELVFCRSEIEYPERPIAFFWNGQKLRIERILSSWRTPEGKRFYVLAENNEVFTLKFNQILDEWIILAGETNNN